MKMKYYQKQKIKLYNLIKNKFFKKKFYYFKQIIKI